jgi:hypothetical protein
VIVAIVALAWKFPPSFVLLNQAARYRPMASGFGYGGDAQRTAREAHEALVARGSLAVSTLVAALESENKYRAAAASSALNAIGAPATDAVSEVLRSGNDMAKVFALLFMLKNHERGAFGLILSIAEVSSDPELKSIAHLTLYGLMDAELSSSSRNKSALLVFGLKPETDQWGALAEVMGKAKADLPLNGARAWFNANLAKFPTRL